MREDDLVTIIGSLNDAAFLRELDGNIPFVNEATCDRSGDFEDECWICVRMASFS